MSDQQYRFLFAKQNIRGVILDLEQGYQDLLSNSDHPDAIQKLLGEAALASCLLAATIKSQGSLTLQIQATGIVSLMVVQVQANRRFRGMVRLSEKPSASSKELFFDKGSRLVITLDPGKGKQRYQGITEIADESILLSIENYLQRSEQLPTRLWLAVRPGKHASGLLLQQLPDADQAYWEHLTILAETIQQDELLDLSSPEILNRLFHAEDLQLFEPQKTRFECGCSSERVLAMILGLGLKEAREVIASQGEFEVICEYCGRPYRYDLVDIEAMFKTRKHGQMDDKIH